MRLLRSSRAPALALALALALPAAVAQSINLPSVEDAASMFLSASGVQEALQNAGSNVGSVGSQSEVWSAFLNAASQNLQGGSLQQYASSFDNLKWVLALSILYSPSGLNSSSI